MVDPHTHIDAHRPASRNLADILGYHYYTELAHSAGLPRQQIEEPGLAPKEKVGRLVERLGAIDNTIQYSWLIEMCQQLFGFADDRIDGSNWESLYERSEQLMARPTWPAQVLEKSRLTGVFLTNDFDDPLTGFDTSVYIPCLRTDDLVFHLSRPNVLERLQQAAGQPVVDVRSLRDAIGVLFCNFSRRGARACAISVPPTFMPQAIDAPTAERAFHGVLSKRSDASADDRQAVAYFVFWTLAEYCAEFHLPFDLMIGVNRAVYPQGVFQGQDLYDSRLSLIQFAPLFNAFPHVVFPISVLASVTNQELASYAWIFPNVITHGHWWYSNTPSFIEHDAAARLEAVPRTKQIAYYSDMYKLEFALPKFNMYRRILAKILAERYCEDRGWSEAEAVQLGTEILRDNVNRIFQLELSTPPRDRS